MTRLDPDVTSPEDVGPPHRQRQHEQVRPSSTTAAASAVPPPPRQQQHLPSVPSSLVLLSTSTTDPSLFSFDVVKKLNQEHLATIPPNPYSAVSIAQYQHQTHQVRSLFAFVASKPLQSPPCLCGMTWLTLTACNT